MNSQETSGLYILCLLQNILLREFPPALFALKNKANMASVLFLLCEEHMIEQVLGALHEGMESDK